MGRLWLSLSLHFFRDEVSFSHLLMYHSTRRIVLKQKTFNISPILQPTPQLHCYCFDDLTMIGTFTIQGRSVY